MTMTVNMNLKTGVRYGYISSNQLDPDLVHTLMYESGEDITFRDYIKELESKYGDDFDDTIACEGYCQEEPLVEGVHEGVTYASSWLGGALNFFIFDSPVIKKCCLCSPLCA